MATRKIIDIEHKGERVWPKGHAKATFLSDGRDVDTAIKVLENSIPDVSEYVTLSELDTKQNIIPDLENIRQGAEKGATALQSYTEQYRGTVTGIKINGTTKTQNAGIVDLGTVLTTHQDISGKQDNLISGTNIKTINGESILGEGDLVIESGVTETLIPITYTELLNAQYNSQLIPGAFYRITDYVATVNNNCSYYLRSANHPFDIIVQALDSKTLSEDAKAIQHEGDTYFSQSDLYTWQLKYSLSPNTSKHAWSATAARDQMWKTNWGILETRPDSGNSTNYTTAVINGSTKFLYRPTNPTNYLNGKSFYKKNVISAITSWEELIFEADTIPSIDEEMGDYYFPDEIIVRTPDGEVYTTFYLDGSSYYVDSRDSDYSYYIEFSTEYTEVNGKYHLVPDDIDSWWYDFVGGSIENFEKIYYTGSVDNLYYVFDTILPNKSTYVYNVTDGTDIYMSDGMVDAVTFLSYISEEDGGKGLIYQMIDEHNNCLPFDFKGIQIMWENNWYYTFNNGQSDSSLLRTSEIRNNTIQYDPSTSVINIHVFLGTAHDNIISGYTDEMYTIFSKSTTFNTIRMSSNNASIIASGNFDTNNLLLRNELVANGAFSNNTAHYLASKMTVTGDFYANSIDIVTTPLVINVGRMQQCNIRGGGTFSIKNSNGTVTGCITYSELLFGVKGANVTLVHDSTMALANSISGLKITAPNWGTTETIIDLKDHPLNCTYSLNIAKNSSGEIKKWCTADLIM